MRYDGAAGKLQEERAQYTRATQYTKPAAMCKDLLFLTAHTLFSCLPHFPLKNLSIDFSIIKYIMFT
jgi:hypothetical protein